MAKRYKLMLDSEAADALVVAVIKDSINFRKINSICKPDSDELEYQKAYMEAAKIVLKHFGAD